MKKFKINLLDVVVALVGCCTIGLVIYLKRTQGRFYLTELLLMTTFVVGYSCYRSAEKKDRSV